jgi:hypothetical protein
LLLLLVCGRCCSEVFQRTMRRRVHEGAVGASLMIFNVNNGMRDGNTPRTSSYAIDFTMGIWGQF